MYVKKSNRQMSVRRRPRLRFFLILGVFVVAVAALLIILLREPPTGMVEWASIEYENSFDMLIVRDEVVYEAKNYGRTDFVAEEGAHVDVGDLILQVYERGYNDETLSELLELQKEILDYETDVSRAGVIDPDLDDINVRIDSKVGEIQAAVSEGRPEDILELGCALETLLSERMSYMKSVVVADVTLRDLYAQEQALMEIIAGWRIDRLAQESGIVSFYFDGCESLMTKKNIGSFTKAALEEVADGKTIETAEEDTAFAPLYRVVDENEWYVVMYSAERIPEMFRSNIFSIVFDDYLESQYTGVVYDVTELEENDGFVYTILIQDDIGPLLGDRRVSAKVYTVIESMRVPTACVRETDGVNYVETTDGQIVPVFIIANGGTYQYIQTYEGEAELQVGQVLKQ